SSPRILHALAEDGLAMRRAGVVARGGNPLAGVFLAWLISVFLILVGGFHFLAYLCTFFYVTIYLVLIAGVMILRRRRPDAERPYRAWGHPWSTVFCGVVWLLVAAYQTATQAETALYALAMVVVAWPAYRYLVRHRPPPESG
ncbi:MAG: amino acid permease, partial [Gammaproteobacteria bacterium]|nr:amino acid permease [Gammaproteobacteria bacterium]